MGLRIKLIAPFIIAVVLIFTLSHTLFLPYLIDEELSAKKKAEHEYLNMLGLSLSADLMTKNLAKVYATLGKVKGRTDWIGLELLSDDNIRIFPLNSDVSKTSLILESPITYVGEQIGILKVSLDQENILTAVRSKYSLIEFSFIAFFTGSIVIATFLIHRFAIRPIEALSATSEKISKGDFNIHLPRGGRDEVGKLVNAYRAMVHELQRREDSLQKETKLKEDLLEQTQNSLQASEAQLMKNKAQWDMVSQIVNSSPIATFVMDNNHVITHWNSAAERITGVSVFKVLGQTEGWMAFYDRKRPLLADLIIDNDFDEIEQLYDVDKLKANRELNVWQAERFFEHLPSGAKTLRFYAAPIRNGDGEVIGAIQSVQDVSEERLLQTKLEDLVEERTNKLNSSNKKLEDTIKTLQMTQNELVEAEKMSSLGSLVGGVAHEVNTPLGVCITAATHQSECRDHLLDKMSSQSLKKSDLDNFLAQCSETDKILNINLSRAAELIRSFKQVAVDQNSEEQRRINLQSYVGEILTSLHPKTKKTNIKIVSNIPDNINLDTYPGAISQVITNLIMNSIIHAFPEKEGEITMEADFDGVLVHLLYRDNGVGMDEMTVRKIFEPFYTTKRNSGGSGLGMHIVYNLITHKLNGAIRCVSQPDKGTDFIMSFKAAMKAAAE